MLCLGPRIKQEQRDYTYLGTSCNTYMSLKVCVKDASDEIKSTAELRWLEH